MSDNDPSTYTIGYSREATALMQMRSAQRWASYLLPHLRPGMTLLDCGCGPGSITIDLAGAISPGAVVGVDLDQGQLDAATRAAHEAGLANVTFQVANATALPFDDATFDVVHAHTLLMHVSDAQAVLAEMYRVLRPGGIVAVADTFVDSWFVTGPDEVLLSRTFGILARVGTGGGGDWNRGKRLGPLLRAAGFERVRASAAYRTEGEAPDPASQGARLAGLLSTAEIGGRIVDQELATRRELDEIISAWRRLGEHPDGFFLAAEGEALGCKPSAR